MATFIGFMRVTMCSVVLLWLIPARVVNAAEAEATEVPEPPTFFEAAQALANARYASDDTVLACVGAAASELVSMVYAVGELAAIAGALQASLEYDAALDRGEAQDSPTLDLAGFVEKSEEEYVMVFDDIQVKQTKQSIVPKDIDDDDMPLFFSSRVKIYRGPVPLVETFAEETTKHGVSDARESCSVTPDSSEAAEVIKILTAGGIFTRAKSMAIDDKGKASHVRMVELSRKKIKWARKTTKKL